MTDIDSIPETMAEIYAICEQSGAVRYVGKTRGGVRVRLLNHSYQRTEMGAWVRDNRDSITIRVLETVPWREERDAEQRWIDKYINAGADLFNKQRKLKFANAVNQGEQA